MEQVLADHRTFFRGKRELMDSSLQSANLTADELHASPATDHHAGVGSEGEHHIHLPNPSLWPLILGIAILVTLGGLLVLPDIPWLSIVAAPFILVGIMGWGLEDPMAAPKQEFATISTDPAYIHSRFKIGQDVIDANKQWLGTVQARFDHYILVERGSVFVTAYYVPQSYVKGIFKNSIVLLTVSEDELRAQNLNSVPDDLYEEVPENEVPKTTGVPMFARGPLSPAETGHYNYGPNFPGINTDASGSYHRDEVRPSPQSFVSERRKKYATSASIPPRVTSPD
jgi:hypothetical protein